MTELILIRHGETDWNRELRFQGQVDVPLNATGHEQARRLARRMAREAVAVDHLVSSDLLRTRQTAELVVVTHGGVLDMVWRTARGLGLEGPRQSDIPNAALNRVRLRGDAIDILHWADTRHLDGLPDPPGHDQKRLLPSTA